MARGKLPGDAAYLKAYLRGDERVLREVCAYHHERLAKWILGRFKGIPAIDLDYTIVGALLRIIYDSPRRQKYDGHSDLLPLLITTARNLLYSELRERDIPTPPDELDLGEEEPVDPDRLFRQRQILAVEQFINRLPPGLVRVFRLRLEDNLSQDEVAQRLGWTRGKVVRCEKKIIEGAAKSLRKAGLLSEEEQKACSRLFDRKRAQPRI
jgi:RNA polymerase sigma factor (sigma-70 family)